MGSFQGLGSFLLLLLLLLFKSGGLLGLASGMV